MPRLLDTATRTDALARAMTVLIHRDGLTPPSTRAIAREAGISVGTLSHHLETRERLIGVLAAQVARRYLDELEVQVRAGGVAGLLPAPDDPDLGLLLRGRLALDELARASEPIAERVQRIEDEERAQLAGLRRGEPWPWWATTDHESATGALLSGLRGAMFRRSDPLPPELATEILRRELGRGPGHPRAPSAEERSAATIASGSSAP